MVSHIPLPFSTSPRYVFAIGQGKVIGKFFSWVREFHFESKKSWKSEISSRLSSRGKMVALSDTKTIHKFMINL